MNKTAMQELLDEIDHFLDGQENVMYGKEYTEAMKSIRLFITTDFFGEPLIDKERRQIVEAFNNSCTEIGEGENYFNITYKH